VLRIRKATAPEEEHRKIYRTLGIPDQIIKPVKKWSLPESMDVS
jgi:cyanate lyase